MKVRIDVELSREERGRLASLVDIACAEHGMEAAELDVPATIEVVVIARRPLTKEQMEAKIRADFPERFAQ